MIFESGMHIDFSKVKIIGRQAFVVAVFGTLGPLLTGLLFVGLLFDGEFYPSGFAAGCAFAPTSVGISIKLLEESKMLNSMAGQTTLTAAFIDDVFSLVTLVIMQSLAAGELTAASIVVPIVGSFAFLAVAVYLSIYWFSRLDRVLHRIKPAPDASIPPRDETQLGIMLLTLIVSAYLTSIKGFIGSHLLGAFAAGMCFVNVPRSHVVWNAQMKRVVRWLVRIFFAASVGFAVPVGAMFTAAAFWKGMILGIVPCIATKVLSGMFGSVKYPNEEARQRARSASPVCKYAQPQQLLVGMAMVARGEFAYLVADVAQSSDYNGGPQKMMSPEVYASVVWALVMATIFSPVMFRWAIGIFERATPMSRSVAITVDPANLPEGVQATHEFGIRVASKHRPGVQRELLEGLHHMGVDILETEVHAFAEPGSEDVDAFVASYVVLPRGPKKDFDDEKLQQMRHHIHELVDDHEAQILFEPHNAHFGTDSAVEVAVLLEHHPHILHEVSLRLTQLGLDVLKAEVTQSKQPVRGVTTHGQAGEIKMTTHHKAPFRPEGIMPGMESLFEAKTQVLERTTSTLQHMAGEGLRDKAGHTTLFALANVDRQVFFAIEQAEHTHTIGAHRRDEIKNAVLEIVYRHELSARVAVRVCHKNEMMIDNQPPLVRDMDGVAIVRYNGPHHKDLLHEITSAIREANVDVVHAAKDSAGLSGMDQIALFVRGLETSLSSRDARQQLTTTLTQRIEHCRFTGHATVTAMKEYRRRSLPDLTIPPARAAGAPDARADAAKPAPAAASPPFSPSLPVAVV
jgi:Kef-type K+ transport system membrane component KefB